MDKDLSQAISLEEIPTLKGTAHAGVPIVITKDERDMFERVTWVTRAHPEPDPPEYPTDMVEGFHTLALVDAMSEIARPFDPVTTFAWNYGLEKVRWISPVRIGDELRSWFVYTDVTEKGDGWLVRRRCTVTVEGASRPAMDADWLLYVLPRSVPIS